MNEQLVTCAALTKRYGGKRALAGVDLELGRGRIVGLLGPNGSGKTTMIKILCGLLQPTEGAVLVDGQPVGPYTKSIISYLPDRMYFADWMKATDLFDLFADFYKDFDRTKAMSMCASLGVTPSDRLKSMSKGTKEEGTVLISTHLISDIEKVLDEAVFLKEGQITLHDTVDNIREREGKSVDALFREVFRAANYEGGAF